MGDARTWLVGTRPQRVLKAVPVSANSASCAMASSRSLAINANRSSRGWRAIKPSAVVRRSRSGWLARCAAKAPASARRPSAVHDDSTRSTGRMASRVTGAASNPPSRITWALAPPKPNELIPQRSGVASPSGCQGSLAVAIRNGEPTVSRLGFNRSKWPSPGSSRRVKQASTFATPASPAAASRCPRFVLTDPRTHEPSGMPGESRWKAALRPSNSMGSPRAVPVPWASR